MKSFLHRLNKAKMQGGFFMLSYIESNLSAYFKQNIVKCFCVVIIFILGILFGAMAIKVLPDEQKIELISYLNIFFEDIGDSTTYDKFELLLLVMLRNVKLLLMIWLLGFTIIGIPFILFILFMRGFVIGFTVGFLIHTYVLKGVLFALVAVLPHNFIFVPVFMMLSVAAISFSFYLIHKKNQGRQKLLTSSINYTVLSLFFCLCSLCSSFIEVYISPVFMKWLIAAF